MKRLFAATILFTLILANSAPTQERSWKRLNPKEGVYAELVDCRSLAVEHEREVAVDTPWTFEGNTYTFSIARSGKVTTQRNDPDAERQPRPDKLKRAGLIEFKAFDTSYGLSVRADRDGKRVWIASAYGIRIKVGRGAAFIVDSNLDGVVGNAGDGIVVRDSRTVGPFDGESEVWDEGGALAVRRNESGEWQQAKVPMPNGNGQHAEVWRIINWRRQQCGLAPFAYDASLEDGMRKHIAYCAQNDTQGHAENPSLPGYTIEGDKAGQTCVIGYGCSSVMEGFQDQMVTLFHRNQIMDPGTTASALVFEKGTFMLSTLHHISGPMNEVPLVYPAHGMVDVTPAFGEMGERPMPVNMEPHFNTLGTCIGLQLNSYRTGPRALPSAPEFDVFLVKGSSEKKLGMGVTHYPGNVPQGWAKDQSYSGQVAWIPQTQLPPNSTIRSYVLIKTDKRTIRYEWEFTTGKAEERKGDPRKR